MKRKAAHRRRRRRNNAGLLLAPLAFLPRPTPTDVPRRRANANICGRVVMREKSVFFSSSQRACRRSVLSLGSGKQGIKMC